MALLAKRVRASSWRLTMASTSETPCTLAAARAWPKMACMSSGIGAPDSDVVEPRGAGAMAGAHDLFGLALAAIGNTPEGPVFGAGDGGARIPELGVDAAVAWVLQHTGALSIANFPADFAAELEVVALVVDGPAPVGLHVDGVIGVEDFIEGLAAGFEADVGHADERKAGPPIRAHAAIGAGFADLGGGFAGGHIPGELAVPDDIGGLRGHALVIECECSEAGTVLQAGIADNVDDLGTVAQAAQLIDGEKTHAGVIGFGPENAIELDGVADGFVDLQAKLGAIEDEVECALGALVGGVEGDGFLGNARGVFQELQLVDELIPFQLILAAEGVGVGAPLDFAILVAERGKTGAGRVARLIDEAAEGGSEDLAAAFEVHGGFRQADGGVAAQFGIDR